MGGKSAETPFPSCNRGRPVCERHTTSACQSAGCQCKPLHALWRSLTSLRIQALALLSCLLHRLGVSECHVDWNSAALLLTSRTLLFPSRLLHALWPLTPHPCRCPRLGCSADSECYVDWNSVDFDPEDFGGDNNPLQVGILARGRHSWLICRLLL